MKRLLLMLLPACTPAAWTRADTAAQIVVTASLAIDYRQTRGGLDEGAVEHNPVMGPAGERVAPEIYFPACALVAVAGAAALPRPWRSILQGGIIVVQAHTIHGNWIEFGRVW